MTEPNALPGPQNETPEDVATLYSWANLHGGKYRDFSAARAQTRENARQRVQQAIEEGRKQPRLQAETPQPEVKPRPAEPAPVPQSRQLPARNTAAGEASAAAQATQSAVPQPRQQPMLPAAWQAPALDADLQPPAANPAPYSPAQPAYASYPSPEPYRQERPQSPFQSVREPFSATPQNPWSQPDLRQSDPMQFDPRETATRPAWLATEQFEAPGQPAAPRVPEDTLQGSRDRLATRWFALKGFFDTPATPPEAAPVPQTSRAPVLAVFSLAGGVGKTSLVATLGRTLSARGERVLLVDTASFGLLPFFFGAQDQRPGQLRTFSPPSGGGDAPIQLITIDVDAMGPENPATETLSAEIQKNARGASRILVDLATASGATTRRILKMNPLVLVPVIPDMNSVVSVGSIDSFFQRNTAAAGVAHLPHYVLNRFDPSLPLHLDVREVLRERLGDRLLPFALRRAPAVSEALAEGMTVMDYAPNSTVAEDFASLAGWVKSLSAAAASTGFRGVRWSER